jgi:5-carboxyvanillate decarboxylase
VAQSHPRMIATEEAFAIPEYFEAFKKLPRVATHLGLRNAARFYGAPGNVERLTDIEVRLAEMDQYGVDMHLLSLTSPGVQIFDADIGTSLAALANDRLAGFIKQYPKRFSGLAAIAPQDPQRAAAEIERAMVHLGLNGIIINSHTDGKFLDEPEFAPILEAAVKFGAPIYLHPTFPSESMEQPFERYGMNSAIWAFGAECSLHAVRMILGGVFDRYPELQIVLGHMGEGIPFWLYRLDDLHSTLMSFKKPPEDIVKLERLPSEYFKDNFHITTCGMLSTPILNFCIEVLGIDRLIFSIDYPYGFTAKSTAFILNTPLQAAHRAKILHGNAERVFKIAS